MPYCIPQIDRQITELDDNKVNGATDGRWRHPATSPFVRNRITWDTKQTWHDSTTKRAPFSRVTVCGPSFSKDLKMRGASPSCQQSYATQWGEKNNIFMRPFIWALKTRSVVSVHITLQFIWGTGCRACRVWQSQWHGGTVPEENYFMLSGTSCLSPLILLGLFYSRPSRIPDLHNSKKHIILLYDNISFVLLGVRSHSSTGICCALCCYMKFSNSWSLLFFFTSVTHISWSCLWTAQEHIMRVL